MRLLKIIMWNWKKNPELLEMKNRAGEIKKYIA